MDLTETQSLQLEYWTAFRKLMEERGGVVRPTKPHPQNWQDFSIGRTGFVLETFANVRDGRIGVILVLGGDDTKAHFHLLHKDRAHFEKSLGTLEWDEIPDKRQSHVRLCWRDCDPTVKADWPAQHEWLYDRLQAFHTAFSQPIKQLNADEYVPDDEER